MPTPAHTRVTYSGTFSGGGSAVEIWNFSLKFQPLAVTTPAALASVVPNARLAYTNNVRALFAPHIVLTRTRVASVDGSGHVGQEQDGTYHQADDVTTVAGGYTTTVPPVLPTHAALAVTLASNRPGASGKGRFFLPAPYYSLDPDYRYTSANTVTMATACKNFVAALETALGQPCVVASSKGYLSEVVKVGVGRVPDTMRSRRNAQIEDRAYVAL